MMLLPFKGKCLQCGHDHDNQPKILTSLISQAEEIKSLRTQLAQAQAEKAELVEAVREVIRISDRKHDAWDKVKALLPKE